VIRDRNDLIADRINLIANQVVSIIYRVARTAKAEETA
jgi:hypothetical protein